MSVTHNWTIANLERNVDDGGVTVAHWICSSVDGDNRTSSYGTVGFTPDADAADFVAYADLTEDIVKGWIWANGVDQTAIESANAAKISEMANPTSASGMPWS